MIHESPDAWPLPPPPPPPSALPQAWPARGCASAVCPPRKQTHASGGSLSSGGAWGAQEYQAPPSEASPGRASVCPCSAMSRRSSVSTHSSLDVSDPPPPHPPRTSVLGLSSVALGLVSAVATFTAWPFPTTVPVFLALLTGTSVWCLGAWIKVLSGGRGGRVQGYAPVPQEYGEKIRRRERSGPRWVLWAVTVVLVAVACVGVVPPKREMPENRQTPQEPVFIAANLYNVEGIWDTWREEIVNLITHRTSLYPPFEIAPCANNASSPRHPAQSVKTPPTSPSTNPTRPTPPRTSSRHSRPRSHPEASPTGSSANAHRTVTGRIVPRPNGSFTSRTPGIGSWSRSVPPMPV